MFLVLKIKRMLIHLIDFNSFIWISLQNFMDKIFGFCFGLVQGVLACIAFTVMMIYQPFFDSKPIFKDSVLAIKIVDIIPELQKILPDSKAIIKASEDI